MIVNRKMPYFLLLITRFPTHFRVGMELLGSSSSSESIEPIQESIT